jgi:hypothetical protein
VCRSFGTCNISTNPTLFNTRWFKYDWDYLCVNKSQFVPVIFEPPCITVYTLDTCIYNHTHFNWMYNITNTYLLIRMTLTVVSFLLCNSLNSKLKQRNKTAVHVLNW